MNIEQTKSSLFKKSLFLFTLFWISFAGASDEKPCVRFISNNYFRGELEAIERLKIACNRLGWKPTVTYINEIGSDKGVYDFNITLAPGKSALKDQFDFLVLFDPVKAFFDDKGRLLSMYKSYTGYLPIYKNTDKLLNDFKNHSEKIYEKPWYPTVQHIPYREVNPTRLFYIVATWGNRKDDPKFRYIQNKLSKEKYVDFYGNPKVGTEYGRAYKGSIPFDGNSILERIAESGVCLVFHSDIHINASIPSGRIFEAVAASAVIISDLNPFVVENFGDSVLYVDQKAPAEDLFKQIHNHMKWIKKNKAEALEMARRSHQIFEEKFLLENQLLDFKVFFDRIKG